MGDATYWRALAKGYKARARIAEDELAECRRKLNSCNRHYDVLEDEARWLEQARAEEQERIVVYIEKTAEKYNDERHRLYNRGRYQYAARAGEVADRMKMLANDVRNQEADDE